METTESTSITSDGSSASYYQLPKNCKELQDLISHKDMNAQIGEIFRSCYRYGRASHSTQLRDAKKILFYAQAEVKRLEAVASKPVQCNFTHTTIDSVFPAFNIGPKVQS